eukprot:1157711-Pelagomonas_calceolata.AAC.10
MSALSCTSRNAAVNSDPRSLQPPGPYLFTAALQSLVCSRASVQGPRPQSSQRTRGSLVRGSCFLRGQAQLRQHL